MITIPSVEVSQECVEVAASIAFQWKSSYLHPYKATSAILTLNGWLQHVTVFHLFNSENLRIVGHKRTKLALPLWKDWIFACFEHKSADLGACTKTHRGSWRFHWQFVGCAVAQDSYTTWYTKSVYACLEADLDGGNLRRNRLWSCGKTFLRYFRLCSTAWCATCIRRKSCCSVWKRI